MAFTLKVSETAQSVVVNPHTIAARGEGGALFGLTAGLYGAITLKDGRVERGNFHDYRPMRMNEVPLVEKHIKSPESRGGFVEAPCACVAPAIINAIYAVTASASATCRSIPASCNSE
jgi:isoquinoline 1-oxidoreductase beta subunit